MAESHTKVNKALTSAPLAGRLKQSGRRRIRNRPEQALQLSAVAWIRSCLPPPPIGPFITAVNPVPAKSANVAALSAAMGMRAGVPDFVGCYKGRLFGIEMKAAKTGRLSKVQGKIRDEITLAGGIYAVVHSLDELAGVFEVMGVPSQCSIR